MKQKVILLNCSDAYKVMNNARIVPIHASVFLQPLDIQSKSRVYGLFTFSCNSKLKANLCSRVAPFRQAEKEINCTHFSVSQH